MGWNGSFSLYEVLTSLVKILVCENYDPSHCLIPTERVARIKVREWIAASEGTFMIHGLAVPYARWQMPEAGKNDILPEMEKKLSINVQADL